MGLQRQSFLAIRLAALILVFCFFMFDVVPQVNLILKTRDKIHLNQKAVEQVSKEDKKALLEKSQSEFDRIDTGLNRLKSAEAILRSKVPEDINIPAVTLGLEDLAAALHVELKLIKPLPDAVVGDYQIQPIAIEFNSEYPVLVEFVKRLADQPIPLSVGNLVIQENGTLAPKLDVQLTLVAIYNKGIKNLTLEKGTSP